MKYFSRHFILGLAVLALFFVLQPIQVNAQKFFTDCCAYYEESYNPSSAKCAVILLGQEDGQLADEAFLGIDIMCKDIISSHPDCTAGIHNGMQVPIPNEEPFCLQNKNLIFPEDLKASILVDSNEVKECPKLDGYTVKHIKNESSNHHCAAGDIFRQVTYEGKSIAQDFEKELQKPLDATKQALLKELAFRKQEVDKVQKNTCCIPKKPGYNTRCFTPQYTDYATALFAFIDNPHITPPLAELYIDPRISSQPGTPASEDHINNAYYYLTCGVPHKENAMDAIKYSCNTNQKFAPPEWAGGGGGIEVPLQWYCKMPDPTVYCACPTDGSKCNEIAFNPYKKTNTKDKGKADKHCQAFIKNKPGWECVKTQVAPGCKKWELICDYSSGKPTDCHCPGAGTEQKTDECKGTSVTKTKSKTPKEGYKGIPLNVGEIQNLSRKLKKTGAVSFQDLAGRMLKAIIGIVGSIALALFVYGGVMIMSSGGNSERTQKGTQILIWGALGVIIVLSAYALVDLVFDIFR